MPFLRQANEERIQEDGHSDLSTSLIETRVKGPAPQDFLRNENPQQVQFRTDCIAV